MLAEKRARILLAACAVAVAASSARTWGQTQVFVDNFNNGNVANSDTAPGFWQTVIDQTGTASEAVGGPLTLTASGAYYHSVTDQDEYPYTEIGSTSLQSSFNFFQQPVILQASGLNYSSNSTVNALTEFNFGSQPVSQAGPIYTEYDEQSDISLEILPPGNSDGQLILGLKMDSPEASTPWDRTQLIGPKSGAQYPLQNFGGQIRSFTLVLTANFYYVSVVSDTSLTNPAPITTTYSGIIHDIGNMGAPNNWTNSASYAPGDPSLNIENQVSEPTNPNPLDVNSLNISQVKVSQMTMTYNPNGDGNWFNANNWSGLILDQAATTTLQNAGYNITTPDYASSSATFPQINTTSTTTIDFSSGTGTITVGTVNFQGSNPYVIQGGILQFATNGSAGQVNTYMGNQTINVGNIVQEDFDPAVDFNAAAGATLTVNTGQMALPSILGFNINQSGGTVTLSGGMTTSGPLTISAGPGIANFVESDFIINGALTLNVASGGTLAINGYIDDPFSNGNPPGLYPVSKTGSGVAVVNALYQIPSVTVSGGVLRIAPSTTANSYLQGGSLIYGLTLAGGNFDMTNNDMVINYSGSSPLASIRQDLQSGSLYSSTASIAIGTDVGYAEASEINQTSSFNGLQTDSTSICIMYTYDGDLNLDGIVNSADYSLMVNGNGSDWYNGDLNYDGVKNADDWSLYDLGVAASNARGNINNLPAPEPASLGMVGMVGLALMKRNRR